MIDREAAAVSARDHFERLWRDGDPWNLERSEFDQAKYERWIELLAGRRYGRALDIGCGTGSFSRRLATISEDVVAVDIAESAIDLARQIAPEATKVDFRVGNIMEWDLAAGEKWDVISLGGDTISCLASAYSFIDVACLAAGLFAATTPGGRLLLDNTQGGASGVLFRPWLNRTYRDLFLNVGYQLEAEEVFRGSKEGVDVAVLFSLLHKSPEDAEERERELW
jgi:SAM-dependent methyltransferase